MRILVAIGFVLTLVVPTRHATAQSILVDESGTPAEQVLNIPYAFYNEHFGFAGAWVYGVAGWPQPQSTLLGTAIAGSAGSGMLALIGQDIRLPGTDRLFVDPIAQIGYFSDAEAYIDGNPRFPDERAGSNDSDEDDFIEGDGLDNFFRLNFQYLLPIGAGRDEIITTYKVDRGLLSEPRPPTSNWNLLRSGKSYLEVTPFFRSQEIDGDDADEEFNTNGVDAGFFWDNRDFPLNPSDGHSIRLKVSRDFGAFDSDNSWTVLQAEIDKYVNLGASKHFRQRVLAFNFWTAHSPSWDVTPTGAIDNRPPAYAGATLGGLWKLRGFPAQRFNDRSAIYYGLEYRVIPEWNPFDRWPDLQKHVGVQWLQFAVFGEVGRVAPDWEIDELHSDMKWDVGVGLRVFAKGIVVRLDTAFSDEGVSVQMMVGQPFQF